MKRTTGREVTVELKRHMYGTEVITMQRRGTVGKGNELRRIRQWLFMFCMMLVPGGLAAHAGDEAHGRPPEGPRPPRAVAPRDLDPPPPPPPPDQPPPPGRPEFGPHGPRGRLGGPPMWNRLSEQERERLRTFMKEHFPAVFDELEQLRVDQRERFEARIRRVIPEMWDLMDLLEVDPERANLLIRERRIDTDLRRLGMRYRFATSDEDRGRLLETMHELASDAFEVRHQREALEIRDIETRLEELKDRHARAEQERAQWIEDHVRKRTEALAEFDRRPPNMGEDGAPPGGRRARTPLRTPGQPHTPMPE